jgi:toxin CcdB
MAQYDVHRLPGGELVIDCQSDFLDRLETRLVVPLVEPLVVPAPLPRLHPVLEFEERKLLLATHLAGAIPLRELGPIVGSFAEASYTIQNAIDFLITGI